MPTPSHAETWSPIAIKNSVGQWLGAILFAAGSTWFIMAYHAWWRAKPYSVVTLNESLAHTAYYSIALAYAFGPLYRFRLLPAPAVLWRRSLGIVGVACAGLHVLLTLFPLWPKFGWKFLVREHGDLTALGVVTLALAVGMVKTSLGDAVQRLGRQRWFRIQLLGLALLPLALAHFLVLGKISKWVDWFQGRDLNPAPAGTLIIFMVGTVVILLRIVDGMVHARGWQKPGPSGMVATP
jgi:DMSO/TMAO reductase YedYZ heme-binding membrane subunit